MKFALLDGGRAVERGQVSGIGTQLKAEAVADGVAVEPPGLHGSMHEDVLPDLLGWLVYWAGWAVMGRGASSRLGTG